MRSSFRNPGRHNVTRTDLPPTNFRSPTESVQRLYPLPERPILKPAVSRTPLTCSLPEGIKHARRQLASHGVLSPSWRLQPCESTYPGRSQAPGTGRPQAFSASRRVHPRKTLRPCFMPLPPKGFLPSRGFPLRAAPFPLRKKLPSCRYLTRFAALPASWTRLVSSKPRLQGFAPHEGPSSLFRCYTSQGLDPLMDFRPLPGLPSSCRGADFAAPPLMALAFGASAPKSFYPSG
jgi:hypothetical protein